MPEAERTVKRSEIIIAGIYCITAVTLCILMQRKNLPELLLVLSSGHAVHWAGVNINLLKSVTQKQKQVVGSGTASPL